MARRAQHIVPQPYLKANYCSKCGHNMIVCGEKGCTALRNDLRPCGCKANSKKK